LLKPPLGDRFGNIVTAVYSAILRELKAKGGEARFRKVEKGKFSV
jgi:hypothetical protein